MIRNLLSVAEWSDLKEVLSPAFFEVMPARDIASLLRTLYANYRKPGRFDDSKDQLAALLDRARLDVSLGTVGGKEGGASRGDLVLRLYFLQLFSAPTTLLDLRPERFEVRGHGLRWDPTRTYITWDSEFIGALRDVYRSYYEGRDAEFDAAVDRLGLTGMSGLFREHFGGGDQSSVEFRLEQFKATFRNILIRCKADGITLHPHFGALGVYLGTLYDYLETAGGSYDVRAAASWALEVTER